MPQQVEKKDLINTLNPNDVLCGRGSGPNDYRGNIKFRNLVYERRAEYLASSTRKAKGRIAQEIVDQFITNFHPPGRFLKKVDAKTAKSLGITRGNEVWVEVDDETALEKAKQALRQNRDYATGIKVNEPKKLNGDSKHNNGIKKETVINKNKKLSQPIIGQMNAQEVLRAYSVPCNEEMSSQQPRLHSVEQASNFIFPPSGIPPFISHHPSSPPQNQHYQNLSYSGQNIYSPLPDHQSSSDFTHININRTNEQIFWQKQNDENVDKDEEEPHLITFESREKDIVSTQQLRPDRVISSSADMPHSNIPRLEINDSADYAAVAFSNMVVGIKKEDNGEKQILEKRNRDIDQSGDEHSEMFVSDSESSRAGGRLSRDNVGSRSLHQPDESHPIDTASFNFRNSSNSSRLTLEENQITPGDGTDSPSRVRSGSVSTMGTIEIPKKYVLQLPQSLLESSQKGASSKGRRHVSQKKSSRSVKSSMSNDSTLKSSLFSEMSMSVSEASNDHSRLTRYSSQSNINFPDEQNDDTTLIDTTAIQNGEGKIKPNLRYNPTTPRTLAMMEDEPDELSSLGQTSLTILDAAMDASISSLCSRSSNLSSGFDSISEYE